MLGGAQLKLIVKDDQSSRETTVAVVDELIAAGCVCDYRIRCLYST